MDNDDGIIGRVLNRREVLALLGSAGVALLAGCMGGSSTPTTQTTNPTATGTPVSQEAATAAAATTVGSTPTADAAADAVCVVKPALTEGPYFVDEKLNRSDIRSDPDTGTVQDGAKLALSLLVYQVGAGCTPLPGATVDVWHCNALGVYSDSQDANWGDTTGQKFLRGSQVTDSEGMVNFTTIYPGWYQGRAVHIHFKIRTDPNSDTGYEFTSQFFFDESITDTVHATAPYSQKGKRTLLNDADGIYQGGGSQLLLAPTKTSDGYTSTFSLALDLSDTSSQDSNNGGGPGGPGGAPPSATATPTNN